MIYVISSKGVYAAQRMNHEAGIMNPPSSLNGLRRTSHGLQILDLRDLIALDFKIIPHQGDVLYIRNPYLAGKPDYLPQIIELAKSFKARGGRVVDANIAKGDLGKGKWADYQKLKKAGLPIPRTWNYGHRLNTKHLALSTFILKWIYGMKAKGTFLISSDKDLKRVPSNIPKRELMAQEYIEADYEYKVITVGYKALSVILRFKYDKNIGRVEFGSFSVIASGAKQSKTPNGLPRLSAALGARNDKIKTLTGIAERAAKTLGRELAKVDILESKGKFYILEVNRFPGLKSFEDLTKHNVLKEFLKYLTGK